MSPDSALGALAQRVAKLEQQVQDMSARAVERIGDLAEAIRDARTESTKDYESFGPMIRDHADMRADMRHMTAALDRALDKIDSLEHRLDTERDERIAGQRARREEIVVARDERDKEIARIEADRAQQHAELQARADQARLENRRMLIGLAGIFLTAAAGVLAPLLGGGGGP